VLDNLLLIVIYALVAIALWFILRWVDHQAALNARRTRLEGGTVQIRIRLALLILFVFLVVSDRFGLESILGAFLAGIVLGDLRRADQDDPASSFLAEGRGAGVRLPHPALLRVERRALHLSGLLHSPTALLRVPLFVALFLVTRGVPALLFRRQLGHRVTGALALLSATSLSYVITATDIGVRIGKLRDINATAIVGAALIAMVLFPMGAQALLPKVSPAVEAPADDGEAEADGAEDRSGGPVDGRGRHEGNVREWRQVDDGIWQVDGRAEERQQVADHDAAARDGHDE
jgi:hypothetical protein